MEKRFTFFGVSAKAALAAVLAMGLVLVGCNSGGDNSGPGETTNPGPGVPANPATPVDLSGKTSAADIQAAIESAKGAGKIPGAGVSGNPYVVKAAEVDVSNAATLGNLYTGIAAALTGDISLDLSGCTASNGTIGYTSAAYTVKQRFVAITLPNAVITLSHGSYTEGAFSDFSALKSIDAPKVVTVGNYSFYGCVALTTVTFPVATTFGDWTFSFCRGLTTVTFPVATTFGGWTFDGCSALATVSLPAATTFGHGTFDGCSALATVSLPTAASFGHSTFSNCSALTTVTLGGTPPTVGPNSFSSFITSAQTITVKVPNANKPAYNATWQQAFKGRGGNASAADGTGTENTHITLNIIGI